MKYSAIVLAGCLLAACNGSGEGGGDAAGDTSAKTTASLCSQLLDGDTEATQELSQDGTTPAGFCTCFDATMDGMPAADKAKHTAVVGAVIALRKASSVGVDEAAELLEEQLRSGEGGHKFSEEDFENTGRLISDIQDQIEDGGSCAAS